MELKDKKVLITGADGFIGSHLTERLVKEGAVVRAFCFYNSFNSWGWLESLPKETLRNIEIFTGDVRDSGSVKNAMKNIDVVFHLAALIAIPYSYISPQSYVETNVVGTLNILQAASEVGVEKILVTSTSEVYGTAKYVPIDERHPRQAQSPYSATKIGADSIAESFIKSFDLPIIIVRPFNTYGPRQSSRAVIPTIISQLLNDEEEVKLGMLHPTRDLLFVADTVEAFIKIAESDNLLGTDVNIATNSEVSIHDLAQKIISLINPKAKIVSDDIRIRPVNSEVERLLGSNDKLLSNTSWKQRFSLDEGLKLTIDWFSISSNLAKYKSGIYNV